MKSRRINRKKIFDVCKACITGTCCREGVDVDIEEAKKISRLSVSVKKPWFGDFFYDKDLPSKWGVSTVVRDGRCVFQSQDKKCLIYKNRPRYCRDFPIELGGIAEWYDYLCEMPEHVKCGVRTHFQPRPSGLTIRFDKRTRQKDASF